MPDTTEQPLLPSGPWSPTWSPPAEEPLTEIRLRKRPPRQPGPKKKPRGMPFKKGEIGNPLGLGGRPPIWRPTMPLPKGTREAFTVLSDVAFAALEVILKDPWHPRHEQAIEYVLNQAHGTARQTVDVNDPSNKLRGEHQITVTFAQMGDRQVVVQRVGGPSPEALPGKHVQPVIEAAASIVVSKTPALPPVCLPAGPWSGNAPDDEEG